MAPPLLLLLLLLLAAAVSRGDVTRRDGGDTFTVHDACGGAACAARGAGAWAGAPCACACPPRAPLYREDTERCVDDLTECSLATFESGAGVQRIPFVFLPLKGQIIHPSREIQFQDVKTPICAVSGAQFLTRKGFADLRNTLDADVPFSLFRDEGRTFLQWSGEDELRLRMSGRVMVVRLLCRDITATTASPLDLRGVFTPCVAFRVQGSPPRQVANVSEVLFASNAQTSDMGSSSGLSVPEYVAIGISSLLLGLIYIASVFFYLHIRKRRKAASEQSGNTRSSRFKGVTKKDGTSLTEHDIVRINNERIQTITASVMDDEGIVKKNPLMQIGRQFRETKSFPHDTLSNVSDTEDSSSRNEDSTFNVTKTSAMIHPDNREVKFRSESRVEPLHRDESGIERLPDEHVSIVETTEDRDIHVTRPVGNTRRKLYFNPAYFEPDLMAEPPPAALEFLIKIREVISIAKHKMSAKRFQPVLNEIPEEETYPSTGNSMDIYQGFGSQKSGSVISLKRENSRQKTINCLGCPGCKSDDGNTTPNFVKYSAMSCSNCLHKKGEKQNSIQKWLENLPNVRQNSIYTEFSINKTNSLMNNLDSIAKPGSCRLRKQGSFSFSHHPMKSDGNDFIHKKTSTYSVRSEPSARTFNLPLPNFENIECKHTHHYGKTISRAEDIRPIGSNSYQQDKERRRSLSNKRKTKSMKNNNFLPDMINDAIALEKSSKVFNHSSSEDEKHYKNVTKRITDSMLSKVSESSQVDYETDSLERTSNKKGISTPTEYVELPSSHASPSLSTALPLEEELTMRNAVYRDTTSTSNTPSPFMEKNKRPSRYEKLEDKAETYQKTPSNINSNGDSSDYSLVSEVYVNNNYNFGSSPTTPSGSDCSMGSRKNISGINKVLDEKPGCLTIEVKDSPENYIKIHESDGFEPDTLDRKHSKNKPVEECNGFSRKSFIKSLNSENDTKSNINETFPRTNEASTKFNSLRHIYEHGKSSLERPMITPETFTESRSLEDKCDNWNDPEWYTEDGRILTLEHRHSKRQRQCTPPQKPLKSLPRPDILPPLPPVASPIYEQPQYPPRRVDPSMEIKDNHSKNAIGRSLSPRTFTKHTPIDCVATNSIASFDVGSPCSPTGASALSHHSDYENAKIREKVDFGRNSRRSKKHEHVINTNTFVKHHKDEARSSKARYRRKKVGIVEDSGYLSSDSACSTKFPRKLVVARAVSCSDSDGSGEQAPSESGAESVETHSVFFGTFRQQNNSSDSSCRLSAARSKTSEGE